MPNYNKCLVSRTSACWCINYLMLNTVLHRNLDKTVINKTTLHILTSHINLCYTINTITVNIKQSQQFVLTCKFHNNTPLWFRIRKVMQIWKHTKKDKIIVPPYKPRPHLEYYIYAYPIQAYRSYPVYNIMYTGKNTMEKN